MMKLNGKKRVGWMLVGCLAFGAMFSHANVDAVAKKKFIVGNKTVNAESGITRTTAYGRTMSDGTVKSTIEGEYRYLLNGKKVKTGRVSNKNTITSLSFSAPKGGTSLTIESHHIITYSGDKADGYTSATY